MDRGNRKPGKSVIRAKSGLQGGYFLRREGQYWMFIWNGELLAIEELDPGWGVELNGRQQVFDGLFEALEAVAEGAGRL